jgi:hypothetical protein
MESREELPLPPVSAESLTAAAVRADLMSNDGQHLYRRGHPRGSTYPDAPDPMIGTVIAAMNA